MPSFFAPERILRRGVLLPHCGKGRQRCRRVGQRTGKVVEVEDRVPRRIVGAAPVIQVGKGAEVRVLIGGLQRRGQRLLLNTGQIGLVRRLKSGGTSSIAKCCCTKCRQNASTVPMDARCNSSCWLRRCRLPGWARTSCARRDVMSARSLAAAAFVKVMMSAGSRPPVDRVGDKPDDALDQYAGLAGAGSRRDRRLPPRAEMAAACAGVTILGCSGMGVSPLYEKASPAGI